MTIGHVLACLLLGAFGAAFVLAAIRTISWFFIWTQEDESEATRGFIWDDDGADGHYSDPANYGGRPRW